ncbi:MAG: GDSL-type esterase/lipase family protein [Planctomycetes bacterium]|nr:GDSL-type esterase/lipase family protein [Planctomycetota bacterium]
MNHRLVLASLLSVLGALPAQIAFQNGDKVAFLGDSITEDGHHSPGGYVKLISHGLAANGVTIEVVGAGISGHKSNDMLARLESDVLSKKPQWMTLSCGVNDVWHGENGVSLPDYQQNITAIVDRAQAAGVKVVILTSTMIGEDATNPENVRLAGYNDFLRALAKEKGCRLADLNADMQVALADAKKTRPKPASGNYLTMDGVHMAPAGGRMMAAGVLRGIGCDDAQLVKAREAWLDLPDTTRASAGMRLTQRQVEQLEQIAAKRQLTLESLLQQEFRKSVQALLDSAGR